MKDIILKIFLFLVCASVLVLSVRGLPGNPNKNDLQSRVWKEDGPFELSPERGRFALLYSFVEDKSLVFDLPIAKFATPDVAIRPDGKYVSLFAPAVSFIVMPGYFIGKYFGSSQYGAYLVIAFISIINAFLIRAIAVSLKSSKFLATLSALIFLFASPAYAYAVNLYQHHISVFLILFSIYFLLRYKGFISLIPVWFAISAAIAVDYPNAIFMIPIAVFALLRIINISESNKIKKINIKPLYIFSFIFIIPALLFYMWFSQNSYGKPFQFSGTLKSVQDIDKNGKPIDKKIITKKIDLDKEEEPKKKKTATGFFKTRNILNGFYTHIISDERGIVYYSPVLLFGILGLIYLYRSNGAIASVFVGVIGGNVLLYSMWGDPWGGWAFGSRYLIPTYAMLAISLAVGLSSIKGKLQILLLFIIIAFAQYSYSVNTIGAITTSRIPPKVEAVALSELSNRVEKYSYDRSIEFINSNKLKSYMWNTYLFRNFTSIEYYYLLLTIISSSSMILFVGYFVFERRKNEI